VRIDSFFQDMVISGAVGLGKENEAVYNNLSPGKHIRSFHSLPKDFAHNIESASHDRSTSDVHDGLKNMGPQLGYSK
jgi:hypothetical protein